MRMECAEDGNGRSRSFYNVVDSKAKAHKLALRGAWGGRQARDRISMGLTGL